MATVFLLYDFERYAGETWAPGYKRGDARFSVAVCRTTADGRSADWRCVGSAHTYDEARRLVPPGGEYRDRTGNWPSPMVPIETWTFRDEAGHPSEGEDVDRG